MSAVRLLGLVACLTLSACSRPAVSARPSDGPVTLSIGLPLISGSDTSNGIQQVVRLLSFEGLVLIGRDGRPQPRLAEGWSASADGLTWTIKLRPNAVFHDGSPVNSEAVKASLERTLSRPERDFSPGLLDITSIETPTAHQLIIKLKARSAFLLDDLVVPITKPIPKAPALGTGPYFTSSSTPTEVVMNAFRAYYRGQPTIDRVVWKSYTTSRTSWAAMMRGEIDFLFEVAPDARDFTEGEASVRDFSFLRNYVHGIIFSSKRDVFKDSRVRRALNYAVDRKVILDQAFKGHGIAAYTPTWPQHWAYDNSLANYSYDPARAVALLEASGLKMAPSRDNAHPPARFQFTCLFASNFPMWERIALLIQRNLSEIGVDMQLEALSVDDLNHRVNTGNFDAVLMDHVVGNATSRPYFFWYSTSRQNVAGYHNPRVDAALDRLRYSPNDDATRGAFRDLQTQMLEDPPGIYLAYGETTRAVSRRFEPVIPQGGDVFRTISEWRLADSPVERSSN